MTDGSFDNVNVGTPTGGALRFVGTATGTGITGAAGAYVTPGGQLQLQGGPTGYVFRNNANLANLVTIDDGGNVGIGITTPSGPLNVFKSASAFDATGGGVLVTRVQGGAIIRGGAIYSRAIGGAFQEALVFGVTASDGKNPYSDFDQARMVILSGGNVGIGTTNPQALLEVGSATTVPSAGRVRIAANSGAAARTWDIGPSASLPVSQSFTITDVSAGGAARLVIEADATGYVGIGTSNPQAKLHVAGTVQAEGNVGIGTAPDPSVPLQVQGGAGNSAYFRQSGPGQNPRLNFDLVVNPAGAQVFRITPVINVGTGTAHLTLAGGNSGNVGIGTESPQAKLHVAGTVLADGNVGIGTGGAVQQARLHVNGTTVLMGGNVGVGLANPGALLEVQNATGAQAHDLVCEHECSSSSDGRRGDRGWGAPVFQIQADGTGVIPVLALAPINGNVGIGTGAGAPAAKLHITGSTTPGTTALRVSGPAANQGYAVTIDGSVSIQSGGVLDVEGNIQGSKVFGAVYG